MKKYRGKPIDGGDWVYGLPVYDFALGAKEWHKYLAIQINSGKHIKVHPKSIGMETGRKDKKSTKIYEGDRITFIPKDCSTKIPQKAVVTYCEQRACFIASSEAWLIPLYKCRNIEVIGNTTDAHSRPLRVAGEIE